MFDDDDDDDDDVFFHIFVVCVLNSRGPTVVWLFHL